MNTTIIPITSPFTQIPCGEGEEIRIVAVAAVVAAPVEGAGIFLFYRRGGESLVRISGPIMQASNIGIGLAIGVAHTFPIPINVDQVSGIVSYLQQLVVSGQLPDIWFPFDVQLAFTASGTLTSQFLTYETRKRP